MRTFASRQHGDRESGAAKRLVSTIVVTLIVMTTFVGSWATDGNDPYLVIENVRFLGFGGVPGGCDFLVADVTNYGDSEQPFGWSWTVEIPKLHISDTFFGQQPMAPGETRLLSHNPGVTEPGTYRVKVSAESVDGRTKSAGATLRIPC